MQNHLTLTFLGDPGTWAAAKMSLDDRHGLWGGRLIVVDGTGKTTVETASPAGGLAGQAQTILSADDVKQLLQAFIDNDFATVHIPAPSRIVPDSVCTRVALENAIGERHTVDRWTGTERIEAFDRVVSALLKIAERVTTVPPP